VIPPGVSFTGLLFLLWPCKNETSGSGKMARAGMEENQYSNISAALIRGLLLFRGHRGATISK